MLYPLHALHLQTSFTHAAIVPVPHAGQSVATVAVLQDVNLCAVAELVIVHNVQARFAHISGK
jgi:hypothetical protein